MTVYLAKLSTTQRDATIHILAHGGLIRRYAGGFWTTPNTRLPGGSQIGEVKGFRYDSHGPPDWYISTTTIRALERAGILVRVLAFPDEWRDDRRLSDDFQKVPSEDYAGMSPLGAWSKVLSGRRK